MTRFDYHWTRSQRWWQRLGVVMTATNTASIPYDLIWGHWWFAPINAAAVVGLVWTRARWFAYRRELMETEAYMRLMDELWGYRQGDGT